MAWVFNPFTGTFDWTAAGGGGGGSPGGSSGQIQYNNGGSFGGALLTYSAGQLQLGAADVASGAVAQTLQVQSNTGAATTGPNFTIKGSSGTTAGGSIIFQTHNGTAYANALTIASSGNVSFAANTVISGTFFVNSGATGNDYFLGTNLYGRKKLGLSADAILGWTSVNGTPNGTNDVILARDNAGQLALKNDVNPQRFRVYSTTASSGSYGYMAAGITDAGVATTDTLFIGTGGAGTAMTKLALVVNGTTSLTLLSNRATFVSDIYVTSGNVVIGRSATAYSIIASTASNRLELYNSNATDAPLVTFGGTSSSFPALKRSSASLQVRLADDSGYTTIDALLRSQGTAPATAASTGTAGDIRYDSGYIYVCTATDTWKRVAIATW